MGMFERLGEKVERFKQEAVSARDESAPYQCRDCGELIYSDQEACPECGSTEIARIVEPEEDEAEDGNGASAEAEADAEAEAETETETAAESTDVTTDTTDGSEDAGRDETAPLIEDAETDDGEPNGSADESAESGDR